MPISNCREQLEAGDRGAHTATNNMTAFENGGVAMATNNNNTPTAPPTTGEQCINKHYIIIRIDPKPTGTNILDPKSGSGKREFKLDKIFVGSSDSTRRTHACMRYRR